ELLLRNEYLAAENRILKAQIKGRLLLSEANKGTLAEIAHRPGCHRRSPPRARSPSPAHRDAHTRWAPSNRWRDSAPGTSKSLAPPASRRLRTRRLAAARRPPGLARSVLRSSPGRHAQ